MTSKNSCNEFQKSVNKVLIQHRSILDVLTKFQESNSRVNRAIAKAVTQCGCIKINAKKQNIPSHTNLSDVTKFTHNHLEGQLCENCKEIIETELGAHLFYTTALCNMLNLTLDNVIKKEEERISTLGFYNLT